MDSDTFAIEARVEETHWWFVGRRRLFAREIARLDLPRNAKVIDIGTGTGSGLRMLRDCGFSNVRGVDANEDAVRFVAAKGLGHVESGDICSLPVADASQELVIATDVIEHVDDDAQALREIARILAPHGSVLISVPAFSSLWGLQDEVAHHRRRYRMRPLLRLVESSGLCPLRHYYFNYVLFAPIWAARQAIHAFHCKLASENEINSPALNALLSAVFSFDCATAPLIHPPFGVSAFVLAQRR